MPVYILGDKPVFPNPELAEPDGLLAVGGDLSPERLLAAYRIGIFPWYSEGEPILWWSPDPRLVLFPGEVKVSRSLRQRIKRCDYTVTFDTAFEDVITACSEVHTEREGGTWITDEMLDAYITLHEHGHAHSVESWHEGELVGGLYGVSIGRAFFGESMFALMPDASKVALVALDQKLSDWGFAIIDCQVETAHLKSMGAKEIPRSEFMMIIKEAVKETETAEPWR